MTDGSGPILRGTYFRHIRNIGDIAGPIILESVARRRVTSIRDADTPYVLGLGSLMSGANRKTFVWGTGVMHPDIGVGDPDPKRVLAVRGKLSVTELRRAGFAIKDVALGDPGFLIARLFAATSPSTSRYRLGLVPHYVDRQHPLFAATAAEDGVKILNVHDPIDVFMADLAACDAVASTSLHGLIFAEALGKPTLWLEVSEKIVGAGFKFRDWYSLSGNPLDQPFRPDVSDSLDEIARRCEPRLIGLDAAELEAALTTDAIAECSEEHKQGRRFMTITTCRDLPLPIFVISFNRGHYLKAIVASFRAQDRPVDIVVHDNGSDDPATLLILDALELEGVRVYRGAKIRSADELVEVQRTIDDYFADWAEPCRYVVTDGDIDLSSAPPSALRLYDELLDRFPRTDCIGPMLRISDIRRSYPLFNHVMNRHIEQFWHRTPSFVETSVGRIAYIEAPFDTTFALHRAGQPFVRFRKGLRVYEPFEARHLDWYVDENEVDSYRATSSAEISHWNNVEQFSALSDVPLEYESYTIVDENGAGELAARTVEIESQHPKASSAR